MSLENNQEKIIRIVFPESIDDFGVITDSSKTIHPYKIIGEYMRSVATAGIDRTYNNSEIKIAPKK